MPLQRPEKWFLDDIRGWRCERTDPLETFYAPLPQPPLTTAERLCRIMREVSVKHRIDVASMLSPARYAHMVKARQEAFYRAAKETGATALEIGRNYNRDHTTVLYGIAVHCERYGLPRPRPARVYRWRDK